ncbi:Sodium/hydrogen exchanger family-domain-containing protein [Dichomitus squalens]|uniref:Sodium/hydrogen exchanger family-domain-containing protein n=1 Tax=Dichomitus squalens TaxID=114155 RepID=A0A4V2K0V6_9APHY|nr:Sodium/hydrogen exchanger family-domain-containing protein [Dichomitus squalens]
MVIGGFVVAFSMFSLLVKEKLYINEVVLGTACGVIFGPYCANVFDPRSWGGDLNTITLEVTRITLAAGLFAIGVELPQSYLADHAKSLLVMVVPTMAFGWLVVAAVIFVVFPNLNFISSMVIAACLTPTDPIISAAIVGGKFATKHVPLNLRRLLSAESAANDGLAYPFLSISIYLTIESSTRVAVGEWFLVGWLYQVILGTVIGGVLGLGFSHFMKFSHRRGFIDRESYVAQYLALALFTVGITRTLGSDDLLAAFAAGSAISWDGHFNTQIEDEVFSSVIDLVLNCGCFIYIGAWMPFNMFNAPELDLTPWRLFIVFLAVMILRRIPPLLLLYPWVPEIASWREALFSGHFGQMGVGAIFVSTLAVTELPTPQSPPQDQAETLAATLQAIVSFVVLGSIIIHGLSIPFFSFGRNVRSRTVSLSHTWTSRTTNTPDWLLWARRTPAEITRPGSPVMEERDVERGAQELNPGLTPTMSRDGAKTEERVPELGPAAMLSDVTAPTLPPAPPLKDESASAVHVPSEDATADDVPTATQLPSLTRNVPRRTLRGPNASCVLVASVDDLAEHLPPSGALTPDDVSVPHTGSGTQTPGSPSARTVHFPAEDEVATHLAAKDRAPTCTKVVRFPESLTGSAGVIKDAPSVRPPGADSGVVGEGAGGVETSEADGALGGKSSSVLPQ